MIFPWPNAIDPDEACHLQLVPLRSTNIIALSELNSVSDHFNNVVAD